MEQMNVVPAYGTSWNTLRPGRDSLIGCVNSSSVPPARIVSSAFHRWIDIRRVCCVLLSSMFHPASTPPRPAVTPIRPLSKMRKKTRPRGPVMNRKAGPLCSPCVDDGTCRRRPSGFPFLFEAPSASPLPRPPLSTSTPETATRRAGFGLRNTKEPNSGNTSWRGRTPVRRTDRSGKTAPASTFARGHIGMASSSPSLCTIGNGWVPAREERRNGSRSRCLRRVSSASWKPANSSNIPELIRVC